MITKTKLCSLSLFVGFVWCCIYEATAQNKPIDHYVNLNENKAVLFEKNTIWAATNVGLIAWDINKERIVKHYHQGNSGIGDNNVNQLFRGPDKSLWVVSNESISRLKNGKWVSKQFPSDYGFKRISSTAFGNNGEVWVGTGGTLFQYKDGRWSIVFEEGQHRFRTMAVDKMNNRLYFPGKNSRGLKYLQNGQVKPFAPIDPELVVSDMAIHENGRIWLQVANGYQYFERGEWHDVGAKPLSGYSIPKFLVKDQKGTEWFDEVSDIKVRARDSVISLNMRGYVQDSLHSSLRVTGIWQDVVFNNGRPWIIFTQGICDFTAKKFYPSDLFNFSPYRSRIEYVGAKWINKKELIIATSRSLVKFENEAFQLMGAPGEVLDNSIVNIQIENNQRMWLYGDHGITKITNNKIEQFPVITSYNLTALQFDGKGGAWGNQYSSDGYFFISGDGDITTFDKDDVPFPVSSSIMYGGLGNTAWIFDWAGAARYTNGEWKVDSSSPIRSHNIKGVAQQDDGSFWVGEDSLYHYQNEQWEKLPVAFAKKIKARKRLISGAENSLWAVISNDSILRVDKNKVITRFGLSDILRNEPIEEVYVGRKFVGVSSDKLSAMYYKGKWVKQSGPFSSFRIHEDEEGNWWYMHGIYGISYTSEEGYRTYRWDQIGAPFKSTVPQKCFVDSQKNLWALTSNGLAVRTKEGSWTFYTDEDGLPTPFMTSIVEDANGTIWVSSRKGLVKFTNGKFEVISSENGLFDDYIKEIKIFNDRLYIFYLNGYSVLRI